MRMTAQLLFSLCRRHRNPECLTRAMSILSVVMDVSRVAELEGSDADGKSELGDVEHRQATNTSARTVAQPEHKRCRQVHTKDLNGGL